jgi:hypothetical protein
MQCRRMDAAANAPKAIRATATASCVVSIGVVTEVTAVHREVARAGRGPLDSVRYVYAVTRRAVLDVRVVLVIELSVRHDHCKGGCCCNFKNGSFNYPNGGCSVTGSLGIPSPSRPPPPPAMMPRPVAVPLPTPPARAADVTVVGRTSVRN